MKRSIFEAVGICCHSSGLFEPLFFSSKPDQDLAWKLQMSVFFIGNKTQRQDGSPVQVCCRFLLMLFGPMFICTCGSVSFFGYRYLRIPTKDTATIPLMVFNDYHIWIGEIIFWPLVQTSPVSLAMGEKTFQWLAEGLELALATLFALLFRPRNRRGGSASMSKLFEKTAVDVDPFDSQPSLCLEVLFLVILTAGHFPGCNCHNFSLGQTWGKCFAALEVPLLSVWLAVEVGFIKGTRRTWINHDQTFNTSLIVLKYSKAKFKIQQPVFLLVPKRIQKPAFAVDQGSINWGWSTNGWMKVHHLFGKETGDTFWADILTCLRRANWTTQDLTKESTFGLLPTPSFAVAWYRLPVQHLAC